jgi:hypothetical protein
MSLIGWMIRSSFGDDQWSFGLFENDKEVSVPGYRRVQVKRWTITERSALAAVTFGPYGAPYTFNRYALFRGDQLIETYAEESVVALPANVPWPWEAEVILGT